MSARLVEHVTPVDVDDATAEFHVPAHPPTAEFQVADHSVAAVTPPPAPIPQPSTAIAEAERPTQPAADPGRAWLARLDDRSLDPRVCPFLRADGDGRLIAPIEQPDAANRCAALAEAVPQSLRQQELVCLSSGHVDCPRYLRGAAAAVDTPKPVVRSGRTLTTPVFASLAVLVMAVSASVAFGLSRGGLVLSAAGPVPSATAVAAAASPPGVQPAASPSAAPTPATTPAASSFMPTPSATPAATAAPTAAPTPRPKPTATPKSDRYKLLRACPNTPNCWIYRVRSGDNIFSIAHYFGVSTDSIYARNPWLKRTGLHAGQELRLPPPTR